MPHTDAAWDALARREPYWAVLSSEEYRSDHLDDDAREAFFASGASHVAELLARIRQHVDPGFAPRTALDHGCGVGRVLRPLAEVCDQVTGLDVSPTMLGLARENVDSSVELAPASTLAERRGRYDLVHCWMVLQHVPPSAGWAVLDDLTAALAPGGVLAVQLYARDPGGPLTRLGRRVRTTPAAQPVRRARARRANRPGHLPLVLMHAYDATEALHRLGRAGLTDTCVRTAASPSGELSVEYLAQRPREGR